MHSFRGEMTEAIAFRETAFELAKKNTPAQVPLLEEGLGVAYLHRAGMTLYDKFAFPTPLNPAQIGPQQKADLEKAAGYFLEYLHRSPDNLEVKWLLNLTFMLSGQYPAAVPGKFLIPPATLASKENVVHFTDVAATTGLIRHVALGGRPHRRRFR